MDPNHLLHGLHLREVAQSICGVSDDSAEGASPFSSSNNPSSATSMFSEEGGKKNKMMVVPRVMFYICVYFRIFVYFVKKSNVHIFTKKHALQQKH